MRVSGSLGPRRTDRSGSRRSRCETTRATSSTQQPRAHRVLPAAVADETTRVLQSVITSVPAKSANLGAGIPAVGQDRTTENYGDAWFVGTPGPITVAVWVGYPDRLKPMETEWRGQPVAGGTIPRRSGSSSCSATARSKSRSSRSTARTRRPRRPTSAGTRRLGDVPTTPTPAPGTATTPSDGPPPAARAGDTATPTAAASAPTTPTPTPARRPRRRRARAAHAADAEPAQPAPQTPDRRGRRRRTVGRRRDARYGLTLRPRRGASRAATGATRAAVGGAEAPRQVRRLRDADARPGDEPRRSHPRGGGPRRTGPSRTLVSL